jgi:two-component system chemotaxis response regulator CheY
VVGEAQNGEEGLKAYRELRPEVMLLDIIMPVKSGLDVLDEILAVDPSARIIMLTAVDQEEVNQRVITAGVPIIYKPFSSQDIEKAFRRLG